MYNQTKHKERKKFCMYCLQCFSSEDILTKHKEICITINSEQAIKMPEKGDNILKYNNFHKQLPVPLSFMLILKRPLKKYKVVNQIMINHIQKLIRLMKTVVMDTNSSVSMITNTQNQHRCIEVRMPFINS